VFDEPQRDLAAIRLPVWGRVISTGDEVVPYLLVGPDLVVVEPVRRFLTEFVARDNRPTSVRSYAFDLLRWWRWLRAVEVEWQRATPAEARDFVLWLKQATKPGVAHAARRDGSINPITGKRYLDQRDGAALERGAAHVLRVLDRTRRRSADQPGSARPGGRAAAPACPPRPGGAVPAGGPGPLQPEDPQGQAAGDAR
jgi:integrase/recombinase XerD